MIQVQGINCPYGEFACFCGAEGYDSTIIIDLEKTVIIKKIKITVGDHWLNYFDNAKIEVCNKL